MTYSELKAAIATYMHRTDLTSSIPMFIELAESFLFRELQIKELQISVDGTTTGGYAALPTDFDSVSRVSVTYGGAARTLDYISLADAPTSISSAPGFYSLENNQLRIWGASDGQAYTLYYIPIIAALSDSNATNWLLDNAKELYLYASALEGAKWTRNTPETQKLSEVVATSLESVKRFNERRGQPSTGSFQIKSRNRTLI